MADTKPTPYDKMQLMTKILMGLSLHAKYPEARPVHVILWTGSLKRFITSHRVVAIAVDNDEHFEPVGKDFNFWDFCAHAECNPSVDRITNSLLTTMGNAGGVTDGRECFMSEENLNTLKALHKDSNVGLVVDLLGTTEHFDNGEALKVAWVLQDGKFYAGPVLDDIAHDVLPACEELFTTTELED